MLLEYTAGIMQRLLLLHIDEQFNRTLPYENIYVIHDISRHISGIDAKELMSDVLVRKHAHAICRDF